MKTWLLAGLAALALTRVATAQDGTAPMAPLPPPPPPSTIPASLSSSACIPSLAPTSGRCEVAGSMSLSETVTWAFYDVRSSDGRHGLSVLLAPAEAPGMLRAAAALTTTGAAVDRWKRLAYSPAGLVKQGEAEYAGMAVRGDDGIEAFSLSKVEGPLLTPLATASVPAELHAKAIALTRPDCRISSGGMDWRFFRLRQGMMGDAGSCGTVMIDLAVEDGRVKIADALAMR